MATCHSIQAGTSLSKQVSRRLDGRGFRAAVCPAPQHRCVVIHGYADESLSAKELVRSYSAVSLAYEHYGAGRGGGLLLRSRFLSN